MTSPAVLPNRRQVVLVVDDEQAVRRFMSVTLSREGYNVLEAENGHEALQVVADRQGRIDVIVTDVVMPWMGGPELIEKLRAAGRRIPVIATSGYVRNTRELFGAAPNLLVTKPFSPQQLISAVQQMTSQREPTETR